MKPDKPIIQKISDTAFWVATYRVMESERPDALFRDPFAALLIGERGKRMARAMQPFQRYAYWSITIRTRLIDELLLNYIGQGCQTVINIGAGLDTRPYRLTLPEDMHWVEMDFPEVIDIKNRKLADHQPGCRLERIGCDLADQAARRNLFAELNGRIGPAIILTEGVIPYLDEVEVAGLATDLKEHDNFQLLLAEYYSPELYPRYQSQQFKGRLGASPFRFFPPDWFAFFNNFGWQSKEIAYLHDMATRHNRKFPLPRWASLLRAIIGEKRMMPKVRTYLAYVVLSKRGC